MPPLQTREAMRSPAFDASLKEAGRFPLSAAGIAVFQVNLGRLCNLSCNHCHVEAGPARTELMPEAVMDGVLALLEGQGRSAVADLTGGAPEMHPRYRWFVRQCAEGGVAVKTRTNLVILTEKGFEDLPEFFAENKVEVIASLPYYSEEVTDRLRGSGVFKRSINALKRLNNRGYGVQGSGLALNLVYNPCGAFLPPRQTEIEADFRRELLRTHGITFTNLFTITNMPAGRFLSFLERSGNLNRYMERLCAAFNPSAVQNVMCRQMLSIGPDGSLYDCDFNQMLGLKCGHGAPDNIRDFDIEKLKHRRIVTGPHCFGCAAGSGSSCTGAVAGQDLKPPPERGPLQKQKQGLYFRHA